MILRVALPSIRADAGHNGNHDTVVPFFLIHLISRASADAEIDNQQTGHHGCQHHKPCGGVLDQLFRAFGNLAVLNPSSGRIGRYTVRQQEKSGRPGCGCRSPIYFLPF